MTSQNLKVEKIFNFRNSKILHGFFGIIEYTLILLTIFIYVSNITLLITSIIIISILISVLGYAIIFKNPYYYISCLGIICITLFPSAISMIPFIGFMRLPYEPIKIFILFALVIEALYIYILIMDISYNKYISYYHRTHGYVFFPGHTRAGFIRRGIMFSNREFDKIDKGKKFWQDQNQEEIQKKIEELRAYEKKFKKKFLVNLQILAVIGFNIIFGISLLLF